MVAAQATEQLAPPQEGSRHGGSADNSTPSAAKQELPQFSSSNGVMQLVIAGAGPAGLAVADRVSQTGRLLSPLWATLRVSAAPPELHDVIENQAMLHLHITAKRGGSQGRYT